MAAPRIVSLDMDGTLIDSAGAIPDPFWPLLERARAAGMVIAPASGRQLATLQHMFRRSAPSTYIAENGAVVWHDNEIVSVSALPAEPVHRVIDALDSAPVTAHAVVCYPEVSFTARHIPPAIETEVDRYYLANRHARSLDDALSTQPDNPVKLALFIEEGAEPRAAQWLSTLVPELAVVVSSRHWIDIMSPHATKGVALRALAQRLGVDMAHTAAIGDYLNDAAMLREAGWAVAMGNAHPELKAIADEVVGTNDEHGALQRIERWLNP